APATARYGAPTDAPAPAPPATAGRTRPGAGSSGHLDEQVFQVAWHARAGRHVLGGAVQQVVEVAFEHDAAVLEEGDIQRHPLQVGQDVGREHHRGAALDDALDQLGQEVAPPG